MKLVIYGTQYKGCKLYIESVISDFDKIRELEKLHKKTINGGVKYLIDLTLMCVIYHGQPYNK